MPKLSIKSWNLPDVRFRPGLYLPQCLLGAGLYAVATACLWSSALAWQLCLLLSVAALLYTLHELARINRCWGETPLATLVCENREWQMQLVDGEWLPLQLESWPLVHPMVLVARFSVPQGGAGKFTLFLLARNTDPETWRRLCLCLRYAREQG
jgi:hypothetical protein